MIDSVTQSHYFASHYGAKIYRPVSLLVLSTVFVADLLTPLGFSHGTLYLFAIILAVPSGNQRWLLRVGLLSALLCSLGVLLAPMPGQASLAVIISNRLTSLAAIGLVVTLAVIYLNLRKQNDQLQKDAQLDRQRRQRYQQWLDLTVQHNPIGLWWYDTVQDRLHWSEATARLHGLPQDHTPLMSEAINFYPSPHDRFVRECFSRCRNNGEAYDQELPLHTADGRQLWVRTTGEAQYDTGGNIVAVLGTIQDLTHHKKTTSQLNESHRRLRHFLDAIPITVWTANPDGAVDYLNRTIIEFSGASKEQISEPGYWLTLVHPDDQDRCAETWMKSVETGTPYHIHFRFRRHDGEYIWHMVSANPVRDSDGRIIKWYGSAVELPSDF